MDIQQHRNQEDATCRVNSICCNNLGDEGYNNDTANTVSSSTNMDNIEMEGTGTVNSIVRASEQN